jgi:hypothetical protein
MNQQLCKIGVDLPVSYSVRVGQCIAGNIASYAHVVQFVFLSPEAGLDISEAFSICQLSESHTKKLVATCEAFDLVVASVPADTAMKTMHWQMVDELTENECSRRHGPYPPRRLREDRMQCNERSSRQQPFLPLIDVISLG